MADRNVKIVYESRDIDDNYRRPRVATTLDPYDRPVDHQPSRRARSTETNGGSRLSEPYRTSRVPRSVADNYDFDDTSPKAKYSFGSSDRSTGRSHREFDLDRSRWEPPPEDLEFPSPRREAYRATTRNLDYSSPQKRSRDRVDVNGTRGPREYFVDSTVNKNSDVLRREGNSRVMDAYGEVEIIMPGRDRERSYDGRISNYDYEGSKGRNKIYYTTSEYGRSHTPQPDAAYRPNRTPSTEHRLSQHYDTRSTVTQGGWRDFDQDDEWRIVDTMRDTRLDAGGHRPRTTTQSSEDSFVMVNSNQDTRPSVRSAIRRTDYPPAELRRRRSRSISFRESETVSHDAGDRRHERPGAEADISGPYLRRKLEFEADSEVGDYDHQRRAPGARYSRRSRSDHYAPDDRYREPYPPQTDYNPSKRDRSRHRRREEDEDTASYFSEHVDKRYMRESRYA